MNVAARREQALEEFGKVESLDDLLMWVENAPVRQGWPRLRIQGTFLELQKALGWKDPVKYIHDLYYIEKKSLNEILATPEVKSIDFFPKATLNRHLFGKFWWIARENTERTPVHERQLHEKITWEIAEFESKVSSLLWGREVPRDFKIDEFNNKRHRIGKALYILKTLGRVDKNILYKLSIEWWLSNAVLATSLNIELQNVIENNPEYWLDFEAVKLYPQSISRWFKYNADKLKAA